MDWRLGKITIKYRCENWWLLRMIASIGRHLFSYRNFECDRSNRQCMQSHTKWRRWTWAGPAWKTIRPRCLKMSETHRRGWREYTCADEMVRCGITLMSVLVMRKKFEKHFLTSWYLHNHIVKDNPRVPTVVSLEVGEQCPKIWT